MTEDERELLMTEYETLRSRIENAVTGDGLVSIGASWGPRAANHTEEERAEAMNNVLDQFEEWNTLTDEEKMRRQIKEVYKDLKRAIELTKFDLKKGFPEWTEDRSKLQKIFSILDMSLLSLGNWVRN